MRPIKSVFILGVNGFPSGSARIEKLKLIGKSLVHNKVKVDFICNSWGYFRKGEIPVSGKFEGINYTYTCGITHRPENFFYRRCVNIKGKVKEIFFLINNKCDVAIVSVVSGKFTELFYYWFLSRISGFKIFYPHHEEPNVTTDKSNLFNRINLYFFNKFAWKMLEGVFPVSKYLEDKVKQANPKLPILKIPAMVDFDYFDEIRKSCKSDGEKYFMYCGSLAYFEIIDFIIKAFEDMPDSEYNLHLVSFGNEKAELKLKERVKQSPKMSQIFCFGYLDYKKLVAQYINSSALLIPLRDTIQDKARLPHKIGEYTASGNPVISNKVGDFNYYFEHKRDALLANCFSEKEFSKLMEYVILFPKKSKEIGKAGYQTGLKNFNYKDYGLKLLEFIQAER